VFGGPDQEVVGDTMTVSLHYSEALLRRAVAASWWRTLGRTYVLACFLLVLALSYLVAMGDRSWWVGLWGTVFGLGVAFGVLLYAVHYRHTIGRFRAWR
jgi:hypothetical protein